MSYTLANTWESAHRRLTLLEALLDPATTKRLTSLGVLPGSRCLELGAGAGSIARWLCEQVGPDGVVTAVDIEPQFLELDPRPNLHILKHDVVDNGVPGDGYDLIHARAFLVHLPNRSELISDMVKRLRPGGVLLLEEADGYSLATADSAIYSRVWELACAIAAGAGGDWHWARSLPAHLVAAGLVDLRVETEVPMFRGGSVGADLTALSWEQLTPALLAGGADPEELAQAARELTDPTLWFPLFAVISVSGQRPL